MTKPIESFEEFWPHYVRVHSKKLTRQMHFAGTSLALACAAGALVTRQRWLWLLVPAFGYGPAFLSHALIEKNAPLTVEYPVWSFRANFVMWEKMLRGTMDAEVAQILGDETTREPAEPEIRTTMATDGTLN